jgi:hypothetical protein
MKSIRFLVLSKLFFLGLTLWGVAQENLETVRMEDVLKELIRAREVPMVYDLEYTIVTQHLQNTDYSDSILPPEQIPKLSPSEQGLDRLVETRGILRVDEVREQLYFDSVSNIVDVLEEKQKAVIQELTNRDIPNVAIEVNSGKKLVYFLDQDRLEHQQSSQFEQEVPFRFRQYGMALTIDLKKRTPFAVIAKTMHTHFREFECPIDKDGVVTIDLRNEMYWIDTKRGHWPLGREAYYFDRRGGKERKVAAMSTRIELYDFNGEWLPKSVKVYESGVTQWHTFDWKIYDQPLPAGAFDLKKNVKERFVDKAKEKK